ncbi:A-kinase anchor protein 12 [Osmerus eperlanus]|uniref:A-kinase anchor protein 12 n=1 Tax=Osmerus eperlanus TaxID=29151 RepID=UPI002E1016D6
MGETQSSPRDGKGEAVAEEESVKVHDVQDDENIEDKLLPKNGQISGLNEKAEFPPEELNGVCEDHVHAEDCETDSAIIFPKEDVSDALETVETGEGPLESPPEAHVEDENKSPEDTVNGSPEDATKKSPEDASNGSPEDALKDSPDDTAQDSPEDVSKPAMSEAEAKMNEINESLKKFFSMVGFKLTVKKDAGEKSETVPELTAEEEAETSAFDDIKDTAEGTASENTEQNIDLSPEQEPSDSDSKSSPTTTEDITVEEVPETTKEKNSVAGGTIEEVPCVQNGTEELDPVTLDGQEDPPKQEVTSEKDAETSPEEEEDAMSPIKRFFTTGIFAGLGKKKKPQEEEEKTQDESIAKEPEELRKPEDAITPKETEENGSEVKTDMLPTLDIGNTETTDVPEMSNNNEHIHEEEKAAPECPSTIISNEAVLLSSQEKEKIQGSPLKKLLSGAGLRKLSKRQKGKTASLEQLQSSTESAEYQRGETPACSPEGAEEREITVVPGQVDSCHESEGDANSDGERKKDGTWASFKKLVTPKRRPKRPSISDDEVAPVAPHEDPKASEGEEIITLSTEEQNNKVDWEAFLCGSGKRRSRKTSDWEDENPVHKREGRRSADEPRDTTESPLDSSQEGDSEPMYSSPDQGVSPSEGDGTSTWKSLKRLVTPKRKAKREEVGRDLTLSDSDITKDDSSFSIKKLISGRKKRKTEGKPDQMSSDEAERAAGSDDEDSETPAVVPLSEFDMDPIDDHNLQTQAVIESSMSAETEEKGIPSPLTNLVIHIAIVPSEPESVQDTDGTMARSSTPVEEFEDLTEFISKHQQLSDITEEGVIEETVATPMSTAEEIARDDTIAEDLIELTSEAVTALEPIDDSFADETTEMVSAVSQLTESSKTSGNTTPVPAEHDSTETEALLQEVVETICVTPDTFAVTTEDADIERVSVSVSPWVFGIPMEAKMFEAHAKSDAVTICTDLDSDELKTPIKDPIIPLVECISEIREAISTEVAPEAETEFNSAGISTDEVHKADVAEALEITDTILISTESDDLNTTDDSQTSTEGVFEVSEAPFEDITEEFDATGMTTDNLDLLDFIEPQEDYSVGAIFPTLEPEELKVIDDSQFQVEDEIEVPHLEPEELKVIDDIQGETEITETMPEDKPDEMDSAVSINDGEEQSEFFDPQAISSGLDTDEQHILDDSELSVQGETVVTETMPKDTMEKFDSDGNISEVEEQIEFFESKEICTSLDSAIDESFLLRECVTGVSEALNTELETKNKTEHVDSTDTVMDDVNKTEIEFQESDLIATVTEFQEADSTITAVERKRETDIEQSQEESREPYLENYSGEVAKPIDTVDEDQKTEQVEELRGASPVHVAPMESEVIGIQVLERQVVAEDILQTESEVISLSKEPLCKQEANITDITVEEEKEEDLQSVPEDRANVEPAPVAELIICSAVEDSTYIPDTPMAEMSDVSETLIAVVATGVESPELVERVDILTPQIDSLVVQAVEVKDENAMQNVPLMQCMDDHEIQVQVVDIDVESAEVVVETTLKGVTTDTVVVVDGCGEEEKAFDTLSAALEIEEDVTEEASSVITSEIHQHETENQEPPVPLTEAPLSDDKVDTELMKEAELHKVPEDTMETGSQHTDGYLVHSVTEIIQSSANYLEVESTTEVGGDPYIGSYSKDELVLEEDTVNNDSVIPLNLADISIPEQERDLEEKKVESNHLVVDLVPEGATDALESSVVERRREEETEEKMTQTVGPLVEQSTSGGMVSSAVHLGTPSSLTLEVKLNFQFGQTQEVVNTIRPVSERTEPLKHTEVSEVGVQATEKLDPIGQLKVVETPVPQPEIFEPLRQIEVHKTNTVTRQTGEEIKRQLEEEFEQDVWLDAEEDIDTQESIGRTWSKAAECLQRLESQENTQPKTGMSDHNVSQDWNVLDVEEDSKETQKPDETAGMESEEVEVFDIALEPPSCLSEIESMMDTSIIDFD